MLQNSPFKTNCMDTLVVLASSWGSGVLSCNTRNMMKLVLTVLFCLYPSAAAAAAEPLMVPLTLIKGAEAKGAVCLDGTRPAYHLHRGYGSGRNSWLIHLEGGAWCDTEGSCVARKTLKGLGSSKYMEKEIQFAGILSNKAEENPDFFNWNRVKLRYCDGASFSGSGQLGAEELFFRGQLIWSTAMEHFMTEEGMRNATQALLSGCSSGGLASIIHCDEFRELFPQSSTKVKCLSDAGMFLDAIDISGGHTMRDMYAGVVKLQGVQKNLPASCTSKLDPTLCFFPQNLIDNVKTPLFLLNAAYDSWQINVSLVPGTKYSDWNECKTDHLKCNSSQIQVFQDFRNEMLNVLKTFSGADQNGVFINSCFAHCQSEKQTTWFGKHSPEIGKTRVAEAVGNWYFDRTEVKAIDRPYPCDNNCDNLM